MTPQLQKSTELRMKTNQNIFHRAFNLYYEGFRDMTLGRTLWLIIIVKLFVIFVVLKLFFFPDFLNRNVGSGGADPTDEDKAGFVAKELVERASP